MPIPLLALLFVGGVAAVAAVAISKKEEDYHGPEAYYTGAPEALLEPAAYAMVFNRDNGSGIRRFTPSARAALYLTLEGSYIEALNETDFKVHPNQSGRANGRMFITMALQNRKAILATLWTGVASTRPWLLRIIPDEVPSEQSATVPGSPWAVLYDGSTIPQSRDIRGPSPVPVPVPGQAPPGHPSHPHQQLDPVWGNAPRAVIEAAQQRLRDDHVTPEELEIGATALDAGGYHQAAALLRARAAELRARPGHVPAAKRQSAPHDKPIPGGWPHDAPAPSHPNELPAPGNNPDLKKPEPAKPTGDKEVTIASGWNPSYLAKYYTGNAGRFKELMNLNNIGFKNQQPSPWQIGQKIKIPAAWDPWSKANAPELHGGGGGSAPKPVVPPPKPGSVVKKPENEIPEEEDDETKAARIREQALAAHEHQREVMAARIAHPDWPVDVRGIPYDPASIRPVQGDAAAGGSGPAVSGYPSTMTVQEALAIGLGRGAPIPADGMIRRMRRFIPG